MSEHLLETYEKWVGEEVRLQRQLEFVREQLARLAVELESEGIFLLEEYRNE